MTKSALEKLNEVQVLHLRQLSIRYSETEQCSNLQTEMRIRISEYLKGLQDAGTISEVDRRCLFCYFID